MHNATQTNAELDYTSNYLSSPPSSCWHSNEWKFPQVLSYSFIFSWCVAYWATFLAMTQLVFKVVNRNYKRIKSDNSVSVITLRILEISLLAPCYSIRDHMDVRNC